MKRKHTIIAILIASGLISNFSFAEPTNQPII